MTRNWSENTPAMSSSKPGTSRTSAAPAKPLSDGGDARAKRMAAIQAALDEMSGTSQALKSSKMANIDAGNPSVKRSSDGMDSNGAAKKKRVLPGSFSEPAAPSTTKSVSNANGKPASRSNSSAVTAQVIGISRKSKSERKASGQPAALFLSKEQQKVLQLVESGQSLFYTGSAGELMTPILQTCM